MNRRKFFKKLVIGSAVIASVPMIIAEATKPIPELYYPSMKAITLEQIRKWVNELRHENNPIGGFYVYGTGSDTITAAGFAMYCSEIKKKGENLPLMFNEESGIFPKI